MRKVTVDDALDRIDRTLLALLQQDGRRSNKELAAAAGLAPSTCVERVRKLRQNGHLRRFTAEVSPTSLGIHLQAMVFIQLASHTAEQVAHFQRRAQDLPEVLATYHVAGQHDFLVHVAARSTDDLRRIILALSQDDVRHVQTALIFEHQRAGGLPDLLD